MNVLLVDDEAIVLRGLQKMINWEQLGLKVTNTASSGEEAIDIIKNKDIDILVTDISMEGMSGLEMLKTLNKSKLLLDKVVIILSGYKEFSYAQEAMKNKVFQYVTKPVARKDLSNVLLLAKQNLQNRRKNKDEDINREIEFENIVKAQEFLNEKFFIDKDFSMVQGEGLDKKITQLIEYIKYSVSDDLEPLVDVVMEKMVIKSNFEEMAFKKSVFSLYFEIYNINNEEIHMSQKMEKDSGGNFLNYDEMKKWFLKQVKIVYKNIYDKKDKSNDVVHKIKIYIDKNYSEELTLSKMAAMAYMSPNYFCALFKSKVGENLHDYILKIRMEQARKLLLKKQYKIYEVASLVGYSNARYFALAFKKYYKVSPSEMKVEEKI